MNKNHGFVFRQNNVRAARQFPVVQPEPISHPVQQGPDNHFRFGVFAGNTAHIPTPSGLGQPVLTKIFEFRFLIFDFQS
jgi:hypothetical protein